MPFGLMGAREYVADKRDKQALAAEDKDDKEPMASRTVVRRRATSPRAFAATAAAAARAAEAAGECPPTVRMRRAR